MNQSQALRKTAELVIGQLTEQPRAAQLARLQELLRENLTLYLWVRQGLVITPLTQPETPVIPEPTPKSPHPVPPAAEPALD